MKPPICEVCSTYLRADSAQSTTQGNLVRFANYEPLPDGMVGHPTGLEWFCGNHVEAAKGLTHLSSSAAIAQIRTSEQSLASRWQEKTMDGGAVRPKTPFSHFIVTRFNLRMWKNVTPTKEWLAHRLDLFEQFCFPSVLGQKNQNFTWLLLFDEATPDDFRTRIGRFAEADNIDVLYMQGFDLQHLTREIQKRIPAEKTHLITTTLDNDDALAEDYVERIQAAFRGQRFELLNASNGLRYDVVGGKLYRCTVASNPFISLIEQINVDQSVMTIAACLPHSTIAKRFPRLTNLETEPLWMQVVHERNLEITNLAGRQRVPLSMLTERFHLKHPHAHIRENASVIRLQNMRARAERVMIDALPDEFKLKLRMQLSKFLRQQFTE
ncbi:MAG: glycosyltransferase [Candidatus Promineifilaceae bacterium]